MASRIHSSVGKSNISINTTLVARQQTAQPVNAIDSELSDPKFNFDLSNIPISSPHRPSQPPPRINPKLGNKQYLKQSEPETEQKNPEAAIQTFAPSTPVQPQEEDETEKRLQKQQLRAKSESQQQASDSPSQLKFKSDYGFDLNKIAISAPNRPPKTTPLQPKLKVSVPPRNRLQQRINVKRKEALTEELRTSAIASPSIPIIRPKQFDNSNFADRVSKNERSPKRDTNQSSLQVSPIQSKVARQPQISNLWQEKITASIISERYSPSADVEIEQKSAPMISKDEPTPGIPAKSKSQVILPDGVNYRWIGSGLNFHIVLRKSWLQSQGIADDAISVDKKEILKAILTDLKQVFKWMRNADIAALMKLIPIIRLGGKLKDKKEIFSRPLDDEILAFIGAPKGQEITVSIRSESIAVRLDKRFILRYANSGEANSLRNKNFNRILFDNIETATGLSLEKRTEAINAFNLQFDVPVKDLPKAYILSINEKTLQYIFGEAWSEFRQTPREAAGKVQGQLIDLPAGIEEKDRQKILNILKRLIPPSEIKDPKQPKPGSLSLSKKTVQFLLEIANSPKKEKEQILKLLKESKKSIDIRQTLEQALETAIALAKVQAAYKRLGIKDTMPWSAPPIEDRPVRGRIVHREPYIVPDKEVAFTFQVEDDRDALRAPIIKIHWVASAKKPIATEKKPQEKELLSKWKEDEQNTYSPLSDSGVLNDKFFEVEFPVSGIYVIEAIVAHNFFRTNYFKEEVEVRSETETVSLLEKEALKGFVKEGSGEEKEHPFDVGAVTGLVTDYEKGTITRGEIDPKFKGGTVEQRLEAIEDEKKRINKLLKQYQGKHTSNASAITEWANRYLKKITEGRDSIKKEATAAGNYNVPCKGVYVSRTEGVPTANLNIICLLNKTKDNKYQVTLHDISQVYENDNYRVSSEPLDTAEAAMEAAFVEHSTNYPKGTMSLTFQKWDETTQTLSKQYVKFTKVTDTLGKDIKDVLFSTPVSIAVNILSAVLTLFPPTTAAGLALGIAYNGAQSISELEEAYAKGTLTSNKVTYAAGMIAFDLIPFVGKSSRVIKLGRKTFIAIEATQLSGQTFLITQQGLDELAKLRNGVVSNLAKVEAEIEQIKKFNPADPRLSELRKKREKLIKQGRDAGMEIFSKLVAQQAVMIAGGAILQEMATRKFKISVDELRKNGLFEHTKGKKTPEYDYKNKKIIADENTITPAKLKKVQKVAYYDQSLEKAIPDLATRKKVIELLSKHEIEVRTGANKTRLEREDRKLVLHVADNAKPGDILGEAYRVKSKTPVTPVEPGKTRTPVEQAQYHKNDLTHLEELRKQASKEAALDDFAIDMKIRGKFLEMERVVNAMPEGWKKKAMKKWLDKYRKRTYEPATQLFNDLRSHLTRKEISGYINELGLAKVKELVEKFGADAMKHYGKDWFRAYKGINLHTQKHVTVGDGHSTSKGISGCHDADNFMTKYINPATDEQIYIYYPVRQSGPYTHYQYSMMKADGSGPKAKRYEKTVLQGLDSNWTSISKDLTEKLEGLIRNKIFPIANGEKGSISYNGITWEFWFRNNRIDSIYPTI